MICFRDKTYCSANAFGNCTNDQCPRAFTNEVQEQAIEWWGDKNAPIALSDFSGSCNEFIERE